MNKKHLLAVLAAVFLAALLIIGFLVINSRLSSLAENFEQTSRGYSQEMAESRITMDTVKQNLLLLNQDSNTVRDLMNLSSREYPSLDRDEESEEGEEGENEVEISLFFKSIEKILENKESEEELLRFHSFLEDKTLNEGFETRGLSLSTGSSGFSMALISRAGQDYTIAAENDEYKITSVSGTNGNADSFEAIFGFIDRTAPEIRMLRTEWAEAEGGLGNFAKDPVLIARLEENNLNWSNDSGDNSGVSYSARDVQNKVVVSVSYDRQTGNFHITTMPATGLTAGSEDTETLMETKNRLLGLLSDYDPRSPGDIAEEASLFQLLTLEDDDGFSAYLENENLTLAGKFREDHYYSYLDLLHNDDRIGSMAVQKHTGEIYLMDGDDIIITSLKTLGMNEGITIRKRISIPEDYSTSSPIIFGEKDIAFVLIGANEANTDTMMVVHLNELTGKGTIITIPRDLYYKGRKINSYYPTFGPGELMRVLSEITGLPVKRYMFIDMFAFADVVDILGGIDIVLDEPLIDPTYRIKENGKWSTLHYDAGPLHLGGVEALRVARSRHSSSDFGRAERQLMILMALKDRMSSLNAGDAGKLIEMANSLMNYVQTDFSVVELMNLFTRFRNSPFSQHVLSWDNVLYNTYSNLYLLEEGTEIDENFNKGAWILMPTNNDWDVIKWYIRKVITE